jgi:O-antigen ligase
MAKNNFFKNFDLGILFLLFLSLTVLPLIQLGAHFYVGIEELLMPIILFRIIQSKLYFFDKYIWLMLIFGAYILFTIAINGRLWSMRDYFEIYKVGKYILVVIFTRHIFINNFGSFDKLVKYSFIVLLILNIAHYFNILNFNQIIEPFYATSDIQLSTFGLDSLGNPAVRRMLGTMGNPNENAILFLFYFAYFLSRTGDYIEIRKRVFIYLAFLCILLTQSRTGFISGVSVYVFWSIFTKQKLKTILYDLLFFALSFGVAFSFNTLALSYFANTSTNLAENNSVLGRLEVWKKLYKMIEQKPFFGYGPNKDYFYENNLYAESEFVLLTWRYGIVGLFFYFGWLLLPLYKTLSHSRLHSFYILLLGIILINASTNCPLSNPKILLLYAICIGYYYAKIDETKQLNNV